MAREQTSPAEIVVRDPKTGALVTVRGAGALKGRLKLQRGIDLTRPIALQVMTARKPRKIAPPDK